MLTYGGKNRANTTLGNLAVFNLKEPHWDAQEVENPDLVAPLSKHSMVFISHMQRME